MTQTQIPMAEIYGRLDRIGITHQFVQDYLLPDWWTEEVDREPGVFFEGATYISRRLNVDLQSLITGTDFPKFLATAQPKFKAKANTEPQKLAISHAMAARIAELVAYACPIPYQSIETQAISEIRQAILNDRAILDLTGLLNFCWSQGIPVVHFSQYPPKTHRFDGMVSRVQGRPVIVISNKHKSPSRLLFIVAHELGHILKGHLGSEGMLVDEEIQLESEDSDENEANQVAAELLFKQYGVSHDLWPKYLSGETLAQESKKIASSVQVSPGLITWNIAWTRAQRAKTRKEEGIAWATAENAIKVLEPQGDGPHDINQHPLKHLDWQRLSDDNQQYLSKMLMLDCPSEAL